MGLLRREVVTPVPSWRRPHALAGLFLATLLFVTSLDALLLSYRPRCAELERMGQGHATREASFRRELEERRRELDALAQGQRARLRALGVAEPVGDFPPHHPGPSRPGWE
jgi:hypothetical protein